MYDAYLFCTFKRNFGRELNRLLARKANGKAS